MNNKLAIMINGDLMMHYDRGQRLPGVQRRFLDEMDAKLDQGVQFAGALVEDPDPMIRAQFVANMLINALFDGNDQKAAAMCSWLATRIPDLQVVKAIDKEDESKVELVFDKTYEQVKNERPVQFMKLN